MKQYLQAEHTKTNCDITQQNSNWIEITGKEKEGADDLEVKCQKKIKSSITICFIAEDLTRSFFRSIFKYFKTIP